MPVTITNEEMAKDKYKESDVFYYLKSLAINAANSGKLEEALLSTYEAAKMAFLSGLGLKESICFDADLDNLLSKIGVMLRSHRAASRSGDRRGRSIAYVASELRDIGGHCEALLQWASCLRGYFEKQYLYTTNISEVKPNYPNLDNSLRELGVEIHNLPHWGSFCDRINLLEELLRISNPMYLALFIHPQDVLTITALSKLQERPATLFFNHTDRNFWLGRNIIDYLVDWRSAGSVFSREKRSISDSCIVPLGTNIKRKITPKTYFGIPQECTLSLSVGYFYKITCDDDYDYFRTIEAILERHPDHYHILVTSQPDENEIESFLCTDPEIRNRFIIHELQVDLSPYYGAADFLIETFPNIGGTIRTEAMACALPIVAFKNVKTPMISETDALDPSYPYLACSEEGMIENSSLFIENPAIRSEVAENLYQRYKGNFSPEKIGGLLQEIVSGRKQPSVIEPVTEYRIGDTVDEKYLVYDVLDTSEQHETYLTYSHAEEVPLVLKILKKSGGKFHPDNESSLSCIKKWAELGDSPYVNKALILSESSDRIKIGTRFCLGGNPSLSTLQDYINKRSPGCEEILEWCIQVCKAMEWANEHGMALHGDIKPSNVLIGHDHVARLTDFGIHPRYPYLAPERIENYDIRSDIYLFGLLLFYVAMYLLTVEQNGSDEAFEMTDQNMKGLLTEGDPRRFLATEEFQLKNIVRHCLQQRKKKRYKSFHDLRSDLESILKEVDSRDSTFVGYDNLDLRTWFEMGIGLRYLHRHEEALKYFDKVICDYPEYYGVAKLRGECLEVMGNIDDAFKAYQQALHGSNPKNGVLRKLGNLKDRNGEYSKAVGYYQEELDVSPQDPGCLLDLAVSFSLDGECEKATAILADVSRRMRVVTRNITENKELSWKIALLQTSMHCLDRIRRVNPEEAKAWAYMGDTFSRVGCYQQALQCYNEAVSRGPGDLVVLNKQAEALLEHGYFHEALNICSDVLTKNPNNAYALLNKGRVFMLLQQDYDRAIRCFENVKGSVSLEARAHVYHGRILTSKELHEEALVYYEKALKLDPENIDALLHRGDILVIKELYEEALVCYEKALELDPENIDTLLHRGDILLIKELHEEALVCYEKALKLDPENEWANVHRTHILDLKRSETLNRGDS